MVGRVVDTRGDRFAMTVDGSTHTKRVDAGDAPPTTPARATRPDPTRDQRTHSPGRNARRAGRPRPGDHHDRGRGPRHHPRRAHRRPLPRRRPPSQRPVEPHHPARTSPSPAARHDRRAAQGGRCSARRSAASRSPRRSVVGSQRRTGRTATTPTGDRRAVRRQHRAATDRSRHPGHPASPYGRWPSGPTISVVSATVTLDRYSLGCGSGRVGADDPAPGRYPTPRPP